MILRCTNVNTHGINRPSAYGCSSRSSPAAAKTDRAQLRAKAKAAFLENFGVAWEGHHYAEADSGLKLMFDVIDFVLEGESRRASATHRAKMAQYLEGEAEG
jgi:hypothetical protein